MDEETHPDPAPTPPIAIIGGGPAGCSVALALLRRGISNVVIYDKQDKAPDLTIGETVPAQTTHFLKTLGAEHILSAQPHLVSPGSMVLWGRSEPGFNDSWADLSAHSYHLDRSEFDRGLLSHAESQGVKVVKDHRLAALDATSDGWELGFQTQEQPLRTTPCRFVVDATGAKGAVVRRLGIYRNFLDVMVAANLVIPCADLEDFTTRTLLEAVEDGWWYATQLPGNRILVSFYADPPILKSQRFVDADVWWAHLQKTRWLRNQLPITRDLIGKQAPFLKPAPSAILSDVVGENWAAVGDAASSFDPLTSGGITKALGQGIVAGNAIADWVEGNPESLARYREEVFSDFNTYVGVRDTLYRSEFRFADHPFWQRRLNYEMRKHIFASAA